VFNNVNWHFGQPMLNAVPALQLRAQVKEAMGWLPEFDVRADRINGQYPFFSDARRGVLSSLGLEQSSSLYAIYDDFNRMVKRYGAHLAIAFAPISERAIFPNEVHISESEAAMAKFSRDNPDVKFLFPVISRWHPEKFGSPNHVSREYTFLSSMRLGKALRRLVTDPDTFPNYVPQYKPLPLSAVSHNFIGPADPHLLEAALAFYLYTQTLDERYAQLISQRVLRLLASDQAYRFMMEDARARMDLLAHSKIDIGFELSQMRARPISLSGMPFSDARPETLWVQVDGVLNFTYKSPDATLPPEPVRWPESSNIDIPLIKEDGVYKFDGYCPEEGPALSNLSALRSN
jgi:hypothetical protein